MKQPVVPAMALYRDLLEMVVSKIKTRRKKTFKTQKQLFYIEVDSYGAVPINQNETH